MSLTLTHADGTVVDHPPFPEVAPGDVMDVYSPDFYGNHKSTPSASPAASTCVRVRDW